MISPLSLGACRTEVEEAAAAAARRAADRAAAALRQEEAERVIKELAEAQQARSR